MKPGLAVLPLEVWADIFLSPYQWINRQELAEFYNNIKNRGFAHKLEKLVHGCGQQTLHFLDISSKQTDKKEPEIEPECQALLAVSPYGNAWVSHVCKEPSTYRECEFPETEIPENIKTFKQLSIRHFDDEVFTFLDQIKPLFANVILIIGSIKSANNMHILFTYLLPMLGSIRGIRCDSDGIELLEQHFPGTLAPAKELCLFHAQPASIPICLNWLSAPQDFMLGPRFLRVYAEATTIFAILDAVKKQFMAATTPSAFVIFLQFKHTERHHRADEFTIENATTKEELTVRNAHFKWLKHDEDIHYVEVLRYPIGTNVKVREWIEKRTYFEKVYNSNEIEANKVIWIYKPTIGRITKQAEEEPANGNETVGEDDEKVGPSTSRQVTKKKKVKTLGHGEGEAGPSTPAKKMKKE